MGLDGVKTKLKQCDIKKVDFVANGAQQGSRISIIKSNKNEIPPEQNMLTKIISKALNGWKLVSLDENDIKDPETFNDELLEIKQKRIISDIMCEIWDYTHALNDCIESILLSNSDDDKQMLIQGAVDQFSTAIASSSVGWSGDNTMIAKAGKKISKERMTALRSCLEKLSTLIMSVEDKPKKEGSENDMTIKKEDLSKEVQDYILELETKVAKSLEVVPPVEDVYKNMPEAVVKMIKENAEQLKSANEQIAKMRDESDAKVFIAKAADITSNLGVNANEFGLVLKSINAANPELYKKVEDVIKTANETLSQGNLFVECGTSTQVLPTGCDSTDAWAQIEKMADALVLKDSKVTKASAIDIVMLTPEGKKLYGIYTGKIQR